MDLVEPETKQNETNSRQTKHQETNSQEMKQVVIPTVTQITHSPVKSVSSKQVRLTHPVLNTLNTHFDLSNPFMEDMPLFVPPLDIPLDKAISGVDQPNISHMMISDQNHYVQL